VAFAGTALAALPPEFPKAQVPPTIAAAPPEVKACFAPGEDADGVIAACTKLVDAFGLAAAPRSAALTERAIGYLRKDDLSKAETDFTEALRINGNNARAMAGMAGLYSLRKDYDQASAMLDRLAPIDPELALWLAYRGTTNAETGRLDTAMFRSLEPNTAAAAQFHGLVHLVHGDFSQAAVEFQAAVKHDSRNAQAHAGLGRALLSLGKMDDALAAFSAALRHDPDLISVLFDRAHLYRSRNRFDEAAEDFGRILAREPDNAVALDGRGQTYFDQQRYELALKDLDRAIVLAPALAEAWYLRGNVYETTLKNEKAIADYDQAIKLQPVNPFAYNNRGVVYERMKETARALDDYNKAIEQGPKNAFALNNRGALNLRRGKFDLAVGDYDKALAIQPDYVHALSGRAAALIGAGKPDLAAADYTKLIALDKRPMVWHNQRGKAYMKAEKYNEAVADFTAVLAASSTSAAGNRMVTLENGELKIAKKELLAAVAISAAQATAYGDRGKSYLKLNKYDLAIADFDASLALRTNDSTVLSDRCWARGLLNRDLDKALADCNQSLQIEENAATVLDSRGFIYFRKGQFADARKDFDAVLANTPNFVPSLFMRGVTRLRLGDSAGGNADIEAAKRLDANVIQTYAAWGVTP
jgi:tetratricopeptide (TPR) repeat protein